MRWVDVMTWLIAQTLNKSPLPAAGLPIRPTTPCPSLSLLPANVGGHCGCEGRSPIVRQITQLGGGVQKLGMSVKMLGADAPNLQCSWHLNGWVAFLRPSGLNVASGFVEVTEGQAMLMRSVWVVQL